MMPTFGTRPTLPSGIAYTCSETFVVTPSFTSGGAGWVVAGGCANAFAARIAAAATAAALRTRMLASLLAFPSHLAAQLLEQPFVADDQQGLRRCFQQVEERAAVRARVDVAAVGQELHRAASTRRLEQALAEVLAQDSQQLVELMDRKPSPPEIGENQELEKLDGRIATLSVAAGLGTMRLDGRRQEAAGVPDLQLPRGQAGQRGNLTRAVRLL